MRNLIFLPAAVLAAALLSTAVSAQGPGPEGGPGPGFHHRPHGELMHVLKELNLSDDQKASVKQLFQQSHEQLKPQMEALMADRQALLGATPGTAAYQTAANNLAQAASAAAGAHVQAEATLATQVYNLLTDAQKAQWATLQQQHLAKMAQWQAKHQAEPEPSN
jgi:protein CpxP